MQNFLLEDLKKFLGQNIVDMLIEWTPTSDAVFTKSRLIDMISTIHGFNILKNKEFRKTILYKMKETEINSFCGCLSANERKSLNTTVLINIIANKSWGANSITMHWRELLEIQLGMTETVEEEELTTEKIEAYGRFFELLDYQFVTRQQILKVINSDIEVPGLLVHMPTGTGKTKTAMHTIMHHYNFNLNSKGLIIWMAHTTELLDQALETLKTTWKHIGLGNANIYRIWGNHELNVSDETELNGFMVCGFQKMISIMQNRPDLFNKICNDCRLIVVDEAHKAVATETKKVIVEIMKKKPGMSNRALIGLTATPGRTMDDGVENQRLVNMFDNRIITIDPHKIENIHMGNFERQNIELEKDIITYLQERRILAKIKREKLIYEGSLAEEEIKKIKIQATANGYHDFNKEFLQIIGKNKRRNMAILNKLLEVNQKKLPTIVFACSVEHGILLSAALSLQGIQNECVFGHMDHQERKKVIRRFKDRDDDLNILINYEVLTTGFDATNIRCVFIARPTQSIVLYSQMLGRGLRGPLMGGNEECLLVDVEDNLNRYVDESMAFAYFNNYWSN